MPTVLKSIVVLATAVALGCAPDTPAPTAVSGADGISAARVADGAGRLPLLASGMPKVYRLTGTSQVDVQPDGALCYTIDLWDVEEDVVVGEASDCLSAIEGDPIVGVALTGTTTFHFGNGNSFTSQGRTTVRPTMPGSSVDFTHITGAVPAAGSNGVIAGTGRFEGFQATVRLSGAVNLSAFPDEATFDCLFTVMPL